MKYYTIQDNVILIADKEETLTQFYNNVFELPIDYEEGKYIIGEKEIEIIVPDFEEQEQIIEVPVYEFKQEEQEYQAVIVDEYGEPILDDNGNLQYETKTHIVEVPVMEEYIDPTTGETCQRQKYHLEEKTIIVNVKVGEHTEVVTIPCLVLNPNWEEIKRQEEQARIQALSMTRSDFFDGTIQAFGADADDLLLVIQRVLQTLEISDIEKKVAINNYKNALNFYRKHPLFTMLSNIPLPISEDVTITITPEQWDKFFEETNKKNPDAYKELLPANLT